MQGWTPFKFAGRAIKKAGSAIIGAGRNKLEEMRDSHQMAVDEYNNNKKGYHEQSKLSRALWVLKNPLANLRVSRMLGKWDDGEHTASEWDTIKINVSKEDLDADASVGANAKANNLGDAHKFVLGANSGGISGKKDPGHYVAGRGIDDVMDAVGTVGSVGASAADFLSGGAQGSKIPGNSLGALSSGYGTVMNMKSADRTHLRL